jgi:hypothetical protein
VGTTIKFEEAVLGEISNSAFNTERAEFTFVFESS